MKKLLLTALLIAGCITGSAQYVKNDLKGSKSNANTLVANGLRSDVPEALMCPENSIKSGEFSTEGFSGFQNSDQGRPGLKTKYYQFFSDNYYKINGVKVFAIFNYFDEENVKWIECNDRGGINEKFEMTKPIRLEVSFYKRGADNMPGEEIYKEEVDIIGKYTGVEIQNTGKIYDFTIQLKKELKIENGFLSVSAVDTGDSPSCWFSLLACESVPGYGVLSLNGENGYAGLGMSYCLLGTGEYSCKKALKLSSINVPGAFSRDKFQKVQVDIKNVGSEPIESTTLELWQNGYKISSETIDATIKPKEVFHYIFNSRVNCSEEGTHIIEVKNVTEGDEKLCSDIIKTSTTNLGTNICQSKASMSEYGKIKQVVVGSINNESEESNYSDFTSMKTTIKPGERLDLEVQYEGSGQYLGVWVDWNNNGTFDDEGEFIGFITKNNIDIKIPEGIDIDEGDKCLRIVYSGDLCVPCGTYDYGETEDYTLTVERPEDSPIIKTEHSIIEHYKTKEGAEEQSSLTLSNPSKNDLTGDATIKYYLPMAPFDAGTRSLVKKNEVINIKKKAVATSFLEPADESEVKYILRYDKGVITSITPGGQKEAIFAHRYTKEIVSELKGMKITSVDFFLSDTPNELEVQVYNGFSQQKPGEMIYSQSHTPKANAWNKVILDTPIEIDGQKDIWVAIKMKGFRPNTYCLGVDVGPCLTGYADYLEVGGHWWQMGQWGLENNYCIRANVSGNPTPAVSWLTLSDKHIDIKAGENKTIDLSFDHKDLTNNLYEAEIHFNTNDKLCSVKKIRVYLLLKEGLGIDQINTKAAYVMFDGDQLTIDAKKPIKYVSVYNITGQKIIGIDTNGDQKVSFALDQISGDGYIVLVEYTDNNSEAIKIQR
ncbi:MAG: GEVED domain-containing protein [Porphyromonadaceae bacterium]|nr:GEVED domain-containing protein [Porphyromonadaceae bacterium]